MQRLVAVLVLLCSIGLDPAATTAQADAAQLLENSARAMENVQSMRFVGVMDIRIDVPREEQTISLMMSGAFQEPDRAHILVNSPVMGVSTEAIVVGTQVWTSESGGRWTESPSASVPFTSRSSMGASSDQFSRFVRSPRVMDQGASYRVSGELDIEAALAEGSSELFSGLAMAQMFGLGESGVAVSIVLDKQTLYATEFTMDMSMQVPDPQTRSSVSIQMAFTFSSFNDPTIVIQPPVSRLESPGPISHLRHWTAQDGRASHSRATRSVFRI